MYKFNESICTMDELGDDTICIYKGSSGQLFVINSTSKFILDRLVMGLELSEIINEFIGFNQLNSSTGLKSRMETEFRQVITDFVDNGILIETLEGV